MLEAPVKATGRFIILDRLKNITRLGRQSSLAGHTLLSGLTLEIHSQLSDIQSEWRNLEKSATCTFYQTYDWCSAFFEHIGRAEGLTCCIISARDLHGQLAFILPFQIRKKFGITLLEWLAQAENNYGQGIFAQDFLDSNAERWFSENFSTVLNFLPHFDVINLQNMPLGISGFLNILPQLQTSLAANASFVTRLDRDYENLLRAKRSATSISKIRRRDKRIEELGAVAFSVEPLGAKTKAALVESLVHKRKQLVDQGIRGVFDPPQEKFLIALAETSKLRAFRLTCDGKTLSSLIGAVAGNRCWLMITSLSPDAPLPLSPGDMLLRKVISWCCEQRLELFDFSNGEIGYKTIWADTKVELSNYIVARNLRGLPLAAMLRAFNSLKRHIKSSEFLRHTFNVARQKIRGRAHP